MKAANRRRLELARNARRALIDCYLEGGADQHEAELLAFFFLTRPGVVISAEGIVWRCHL